MTEEDEEFERIEREAKQKTLAERPTKKEAMKLALEAIENMSTALREDDVLGNDIDMLLDAITALQEAPAEQPAPVQQEPVACRYGDNGYACCEGGLCAAEEHNYKTDWQERGMVAEAALAKLLYEKGEPVAVVSGYYGGQCVILPIDPARIFNSNAPLYTSPPAQRTWVGLTIEDKKEYIARDFGGSRTDAMDWTEKRLMEKNT